MADSSKLRMQRHISILLWISEAEDYCYIHFISECNTVFMGYILVSSRLKRYFQIILLLLGLFAVWSCNSRGCIAVWLLILTYRLFFYKQNVWKVLIALFFLYMIIPNVIVLVQQSGLLGRFNFVLAIHLPKRD